jgi:hypothetical protein
VTLAKEKFTVLYQFEDAGGQGWANWKEKEIVVSGGKEKNAGYTVGSGLLTGEVQACKCVTIEAESAEEAAEALRGFYGQNIVTGKFLAGKSASLSEVNAIP